MQQSQKTQILGIMDRMVYKIKNSKKKILPEFAYECMITSLEEAISRIKEEVKDDNVKQSNDWIPVSERLPDIWDKVIFNNINNSSINVWTVIQADIRNSPPYTHWQPLPLPPTNN